MGVLEVIARRDSADVVAPQTLNSDALLGTHATTPEFIYNLSTRRDMD
jgi:hypothetical protein